MLPCGFIHGKEESKYEIVARPFVNEVWNGSGNYNKDCAYDCITFQFIHSCIVCKESNRYTGVLEDDRFCESYIFSSWWTIGIYTKFVYSLGDPEITSGVSFVYLHLKSIGLSISVAAWNSCLWSSGLYITENSFFFHIMTKKKKVTAFLFILFLE